MTATTETRRRGTEERRARGLLADALVWLREGERWTRGALVRADGLAEGGLRACAAGAVEMSPARGYPLRTDAGRRAILALALAFEPEARCGESCRTPSPDGGPPCGACALDVVAARNDAAESFAPVGKAFARAIEALRDGEAAA